MVPLAKHAESTVQKTVRYGLMPAGPSGNFPGSNSHGLGIPAGSKKKEAAWEFIKWALSKETVAKIVRTHGYPSVCRRSVIDSPEFKSVLTLNGQDVASLYLEVLQLGGKGGYMKYRTVPVYPQVGDKINKAIERIATRQQDAPAAMKQAQAEAIQDLQKAGVKIDL
jgi:multiple sugar transport system substrate-binding protein